MTADAPGMAEPLGSVPGGDAQAAFVVRDVHVTFEVYEDRRPNLRDVAAGRVRRRAIERVEAVRGVSLVAHRGDAIGVIGRNGSGKTTLLRAIAGLVSPREGDVLVRSQPVLLGVNAAMHPSLSGRLNVYLGGVALGLRRDQIEDRFDDIVAFAGLEREIDRPLRTYSTGMKARLQFSVASAVTPEILMVDEALGGGDAEFRQRSSERIRRLLELAGTVVLVSHSLPSIEENCSRVLWLDAGRVVREGDAREVVAAYRESVASARSTPPPPARSDRAAP